jgi:hypothetical protein
MPNKKSDEPEMSADEQALEHRVDVMMSTELVGADPAVSVPVAEKPDDKKPTSKVTGDQKTAPKLPAKLLKNVKSDEAPEPKTPAAPPIVIALADETEPGPNLVSEDGQDTEADVAEAAEFQTEPAQDQNQKNDLLEDSSTDEAVDEIVANESDTILAVDDALAVRKQRLISAGQTHGGFVKHKWIWFLGFVVLLGTAIDLFIFISG